MNRESFFKTLFGTGAVIAIAPAALIKPDELEYIVPKRYFIAGGQKGVMIDLDKIPHGYTLEDIVWMWKNHGIMIIDSGKI